MFVSRAPFTRTAGGTNRRGAKALQGRSRPTLLPLLLKTEEGHEEDVDRSRARWEPSSHSGSNRPRDGSTLIFRRILVPVDFTGKTLRVVRSAGRLAEALGGGITLLHVIERIDDDSPALRKFYAGLETEARRKLRPLAEELAGKKVAVHAEIAYGNRVAEILRFAQENGTDLIVMSSHRLPLRRPTVESWGTISYKVGILSRCPVLLVK